jgi:hypothetical protein
MPYRFCALDVDAGFALRSSQPLELGVVTFRSGLPMNQLAM